MEAVSGSRWYNSVIYIAGAIAAAIVLINLTDGGWNTALALGSQYISSTCRLSFDLQRRLHSGAGLIGGSVLTMSTHGTDQYRAALTLHRPPESCRAALL